MTVRLALSKIPMSPFPPSAARRVGQNNKPGNETASNDHPTMLDIGLEELKPCSGTCYRKSSGCACKVCPGSRSKPILNNSNRCVYGSQGGQALDRLTAAMNAFGLQNASYSSDTSFPRNNSFDEQAAPAPAQGDLEHHVRSRRHIDTAQARQRAVPRYLDEDYWNDKPWVHFIEEPDNASEQAMDMSDEEFMADSMQVNIDRSDATHSVKSTHPSTLSDLIFGVGDHFGVVEKPIFEDSVFEGHNWL